MSERTNENCLEGVKCPQCSSLEPFKIGAAAGSAAACRDDACRRQSRGCGESAKAGDFKEEEP